MPLLTLAYSHSSLTEISFIFFPIKNEQYLFINGTKAAITTKFYAIAEKMMARRGRTLTEADKTIFEAIYNQAEQLK